MEKSMLYPQGNFDKTQTRLTVNTPSSSPIQALSLRVDLAQTLVDNADKRRLIHVIVRSAFGIDDEVWSSAAHAQAVGDLPFHALRTPRHPGRARIAEGLTQLRMVWFGSPALVTIRAHAEHHSPPGSDRG